jgi:hypothetical protein
MLLLWQKYGIVKQKDINENQFAVGKRVGAVDTLPVQK